MAVLVVHKLEQALVEEGGQVRVLPRQAGQVLVQVDRGEGECADLGIAVVPGPVPAVGVGLEQAGRAKEFHGSVLPWVLTRLRKQVYSFFHRK